MPDLARLRSDLAAFPAAVGQSLTDSQPAAPALEKRTTVIVAPRQSGKSRSIGVAALHQACRHPGTRAEPNLGSGSDGGRVRVCTRGD